MANRDERSERQLCDEAGKAKKGRREREKSREDWMRMARWPLISSRERETVPGSTKNEEGSLTRGGIGRGAREKKRKGDGRER